MLATPASLISNHSWRKLSGGSSYLVTRDDGVAGYDERRRTSFPYAAVLAIAMLWPVAALSDAGPRDVKRFDIPRQRADQALIEFAEQADVTFIFPAAQAKKVTANAVRGELTPQEAIAKLLQGTGLQPGFNASGVWTVKANDESSDKGDAMKRSGLIASLIAALSGAGHANGEEAGGSTPTSLALEEVVVTAQKREERLADVPVPVTAIDAVTLATQSQVLLRDYFATVPGLNVAPGVQSNQTVSIRGITTGTGNPTVAILIDDVPYGAATNIGGGRFIPEIDPGDLARIEVLRGPQGTLYGASSLGGLLKFVTRDPTTEEFNGALQVGMSDVRGGDDPGYSLRGSVNVPLSDAWAVRASAFTRRDAGYIDNIRTSQADVNETTAQGGRLSTLWQPSDSFSLKLTALAQELEEDGQSFDAIALPDLQQNQLAGSGWSERKTQSYTATLTSKIASADLTSLTGYTINQFSGSTDFGNETLGHFDGSKLTQELRLSMPIGERLEWLIGAFYTDEDSELTQTTITVDQATGTRTGFGGFTITPTTVEELAAFTDLTVQFTERFDVQFGVRGARIRQTFNEQVTNAAGVITVRPELHPGATAFTYLVTPRLKLSPDLMVYARLASGYRPGGANPSPGGVVPPQYEPDKTQNFELGLKGDFLDRRVSLDASAYFIEWKDFQFNLFNPALITYTSNGGRARSRGIELAAGLRPLSGLTIDGWVSWGEAELTENFSPAATAIGVSGDRLPFSSRFTAHVDVEQEFPLWNEVSFFVGAAANRVGERFGPFRNNVVRQVFPAYTQVDLRAGMRSESWSVDLFATNVTDERGALAGGLGALPSNALVYIRPRTVGLSLTKNF
jgi:iron complex outermembrane recepter protein